MKHFICLLLLLVTRAKLPAQQQAVPVTDAAPVQYEGLKFGYNIVSEREKEVGNKGDFSRYKLRFFVTNTSSQAKVILRKPGFLINSTSPYLVQFKCLNATGARFTSREASIEARPCIVEALVDDKDCASGKTRQNLRPVNIGYWIKPGETITTMTIFIVPLNARPDITATLFPVNNNTIVGSADLNQYGFGDPVQQLPVQSLPGGFIRVKNFAANTYLNNRNGSAACTAVAYNWQTAQWELMPVSGTNYYLIRNRLSGNFISTDNATMLSGNAQSQNAMWMIDPIGVNNAYTFTNAGNKGKLLLQDNILMTIRSFTLPPGAQWIIEP